MTADEATAKAFEIMSNPIRIAVIDDQPIFREGVLHTLDQADVFAVAGVGASADDARKVERDAAPDIMLLDISMPGGGLEAARDIARTSPDIKIMMLTISEDQNHVHEALEVGAKGYILKGISGSELVRTILSVHAGDVYITPNLAARILTLHQRKAVQRSSEAPHDAIELNSREQQILELLAKGQTNREIAEQIELSEKTIKRYMSTLLQKLHARNRVEAALIAHRRLN